MTHCSRPTWRDARPEDDEAVVAMCLALNREDPGPRPVDAANTRRTLEVLRRDPRRGRAVVLDDGSRCVGYALLIAFWSNERGGEVCVVDELFVEPARRSQGHGTELFRNLTGGSLWVPLPVSIDLAVTPHNANARRLYERLGFVETGTSLALMLDDHRGDRALVRPERPSEFDAIRALVHDAFRTAPHADGDEHLYVDRLRASGAYLPELALVLEEASELLGHVMLTRLAIDIDGGRRAVLLLSPLSVRPHDHHRGLGSRLVREALDRARTAGHDAVLLVGNPRFYARFGFRRSSELGVTNVDGFDDAAVQALELVPGALRGVRGTVTFPK